MSPHPHRQRLLLWLESLPEALPSLAPVPRSCMAQAMEAEHLAIAFNLDRQAFRITHSVTPERQAAVALVECRFGRPPDHWAGEAFRRLLSINFEASIAMPCGFCLDGESGDVWLCTSIDLEHDTLHTLVHGIASATLLASLWRQSFFLDPAAPTALLPPAATHKAAFQAA